MTVPKLLTAVPAGSLGCFRLRQNTLLFRFYGLPASPEILLCFAPLLYH